ncbi:MAG TPA: hypothetical protein EYO58_02515 [Flavobacteriales bacterium]|nr:hypothetical protein [Flavobacteriales bacterium]
MSAEKILVVTGETDLEARVAKFFSAQISGRVYRFFFASSGAQALALSQQYTDFGVMVSAVELPDMTVFSLLQAFPILPITVLVSRQDDQENFRQAMSFGVYDMLFSPLENPLFRTTLQGAVYAAKRQRSLQLLQSDYQYSIQQRDVAITEYHARNQLLNHLHHELRTPLNAVVGYSQLLLEQSLEDELPAYTEILNHLQHTGEQLLQLVNQLLDLAKLEAGAMTLDCQPLDVKDLLDDLALTVSPLFSTYGCRFVVSGDVESSEFRADRRRLTQSLGLLLKGLTQYVETDFVSMVVTRREGLVEFCLSGIQTAESEQIFQPVSDFSALSMTEGVSGLELSLSRNLWAFMGGEVVMEADCFRWSLTV